MGGPGYDLPDWRNPQGYAALVGADRSCLAWEWLRRHPGYREAVDRSARQGADGFKGAQEWGLHRFETPSRSLPEARPMWTADRHRWVLFAHSQKASHGPDSLDLTSEPRARLIRSSVGQYLLLSDGYRCIRLDVTGERLDQGPVELRYRLAGLRSLERPLLVLERLRYFARNGRLKPSHFSTSARGRALLLLRAADALQSGANQSDIAEILLAPTLDRRRWRIHSPSIRSQSQRLVRKARALAAGGFWALLD